MNQQAISSFWSATDLLRGNYKQSEYGKVILPFTVPRRLDCVLEVTKEAILAELAERWKMGLSPEPFLLGRAGQEREQQGFNDCFGPGLPRVSDGSLLFLLHLISKMRLAAKGGARFVIVLDGSPLFTGVAGSGVSDICRYVLENDPLEAITGLPTDMFYNTGITIHVWILTNRKPEYSKGLVQLIDASSVWRKMRKSIGNKRKKLSEDHIAEVTRLFGQFIQTQVAIVLDAEDKEIACQVLTALDLKPTVGAPAGGKVKLAPLSRIFKNQDFRYRTITVELPVGDETGQIVLGSKGKLKGKPQADSSLRNTENVHLSQDVAACFKREVLPHAPDVRIDHKKTKVGYDTPFNRHFHLFVQPRPLEETNADMKVVTDKIIKILPMIGGLSA